MRLSFGVPQGSVLGPTLFDIHTYRRHVIRPLSRFVYVDDTEMHSSSKNIDLVNCVKCQLGSQERQTLTL